MSSNWAYASSVSVAGLSSEQIILMVGLILPSSFLAETALASRVGASMFFGSWLTVCKVVSSARLDDMSSIWRPDCAVFLLVPVE